MQVASLIPSIVIRTRYEINVQVQKPSTTEMDYFDNDAPGSRYRLSENIPT